MVRRMSMFLGKIIILLVLMIFVLVLNIAEWGSHGEFGAEAAAKHAFGKSAIALSSSEAALLAAALPSPKRRDAARPSASLRRTTARYTRYRSVADLSITACLTSK